jgi:hypothetical protein
MYLVTWATAHQSIRTWSQFAPTEPDAGIPHGRYVPGTWFNYASVRPPGLHVLPICTPLIFICRDTWREKVYATEVRDRDDLVNRTEVTAADIVPRQLLTVRGSIRRRCVCSGGGRTLRTSVAITYSTFSALTSPHHTNRKVLKKKYSEVTIEKCYKG